MSEENETIVTPKIQDYRNWWKGLSYASDFCFRNAVLELIDNAYSSCVSPPDGVRPTNPTIEVVLIGGGREEHQLFACMQYGVFSSSKTSLNAVFLS